MTSKFDDVTVKTIVKDSVNSTCKLIDMTILSDRNIAVTEMKTKSKCKDLKLEIQRMWQMKTEVTPVVVVALGTVKKRMVEKIKKKIRESYCDRDSKDLLAGVCTNPQEGAYCMNRMTDLSD